MTSQLSTPTVVHPWAFDLGREPWVLARTLSGSTEACGLVDLVQRAGELDALVGELPTQAFALQRLLLALLHRAVEWDEDDPVGHWQAAWEGEVDLGDAVARHVEEHRERFDLLHPETPFFQVAGLRSAGGGVSALTTLIADVPNGAPYFTTRAGPHLERLRLAEAARWLVHLQAFDASGIRTGVVGDPRAKGGPRSYPIGTGSAGALGGVLLQGRSLRETLLLNLVLTDRDGVAWPAGDLAAWERSPDGPAPRAVAQPLGPADLLTWQSRRVRLVADGGQVTGVVVSNGDPLAAQHQLRTETMTAWRRSPNQEKLQKQVPVYLPARHEPTRAMWRGLPALLLHEVAAGRGEPATQVQPGVLRWASRLVDQLALPVALTLRARATGMRYGIQSATVEDIVDDGLVVHAVLLGERGEVLRLAALDAVGAAEGAARALGDFAADLASAAGGVPDGHRDRLVEMAYFSIDAPFRQWLAALRDGIDAEEAKAGWHRTVRSALWRLGQDAVQTISPTAWAGRTVKTRMGTSRFVSAATAAASFSANLARAVPLAYPPPPGGTQLAQTSRPTPDIAEATL